ncbi:MAG: penicillin acylase family protein [Lewinellaceae bacterium]|nr:penicillin acylase family protein [Lewinellaceae bacterium]
MKYITLLLFFPVMLMGQSFSAEEIARWQQRAQQITITRDSWDVPHIYGKTDADAVFGVLFTQCEDDFPRVEDNYLIAIGRKAEVDGEAYLFDDLRARLFLDSTQAVAIYQRSPGWMKALLDGFADGVNYYLYTHPEVKPRLLKRFEPWMPLCFSEGSIGGNISAVSVNRLKAFYEDNPGTAYREEPKIPGEEEPVGSNGFAIAPGKTADGNALLLINPHTSFYFRSEVHMNSEKGLNAYGAVTWGQFFIYQGFNQNCGWMHTSSGADVLDEYLETMVEQNGRWYYRYGEGLRPVTTKEITLSYLKEGVMQKRTFTGYFTHHGPIVGRQGDQWLSIRMMNEPLNALAQSYLRTKAKGYKGFQKVMKLRTNSSNNTVFADRQGNIAYWHGNFMPRRNSGFDWSQPVDGSDPRTEWQGLHGVKETIQLLNPATGWIQNCNATPFTVSGSASPTADQYPAYMAPDAENFRGIHAVRVLSRGSNWTLDNLITAAFDPELPGFEALLPGLLSGLPANMTSTQDADVRDALNLLRNWDFRFDTASVATTVATYWAENLTQVARSRAPRGGRLTNITFIDFMLANTTPEEKAQALRNALQTLKVDFGKWQTPWGAVNRCQRITSAIQATFDDDQPSIPVGFASATWGSLASFGARTYPGTKKRYGTSGNSFVAVVEFGPRVQARSIVVGGQSGDPNSPHFNDQSEMFCNGEFKTVNFYPEDVRKNASRTYHPGQ